MSARRRVRLLEGWTMRFFLVGRDRNDGTVRLLDSRAHASKQDALDAAGVGPSADEDLFVVDLEDAAPVLMMRSPQEAPESAVPEPVPFAVPEPEPVAEPETLPAQEVASDVAPSPPAPVFHLAAPVPAEPEPVLAPAPTPLEPWSAPTSDEAQAPTPLLKMPEPVELPVQPIAGDVERSADASMTADEVSQVASSPFAAALRGASQAMESAAPKDAPVIASTPPEPETGWRMPAESGPAPLDGVEGETDATPSFNAFTYPVHRGTSVDASPPASESAPTSDANVTAEAVVTRDAEYSAPSATAPEFSPVGREDLASALEQLAAVAQFSAGLTTSDVGGPAVPADKAPVPIDGEAPTTDESALAAEPVAASTIDPAVAKPFFAETAVPEPVAPQPPVFKAPFADVPSTDAQPWGSPGAAAAAPEASTGPTVDAGPDPVFTPPVGQPEEPSYVPSKEDIAGWTCAECVYVTTCPRSGQDRPATCGSFQWRTG